MWFRERVMTSHTDDVVERPADLTADPGAITASVDVLGHAPLRLVAKDGRVSHFPRAWVTVRTADGRSGVGWLEWNRNQSSR